MNARMYSLLLCLYPAELRHDFGAEMMQVFLDDLSDSRRQGLFGVVRVWWRSLKELVCIALPASVSRRLVLVPLLTYVLLALYQLGGIVILERGEPGSQSVEEYVAFILLPGLFPAFIAFIALCIGDHSVPEPLNLR